MSSIQLHAASQADEIELEQNLNASQVGQQSMPN